MQTNNHFQFNLNMSKAYEKDGEYYIESDVSDTRLDYHDQHMTEKAMDSMQSMLKNGFKEPDGSLQKVYLLPSHSDTFEMGYATDGKISKSADGHIELAATWQLLKDNPQAMQLFKEVASGKCKKQLSVGGDAVGHAYFNEELGKTVGSLDDVVKLEHVACTRPGKAAVKSTGFIGAMLKSIEGLGSERMAFEKTAMTDAQRKSNATIVWDNTKSHDFLADGGKLYLAPIPDGDRMAAKVALSNLHSWPYTSKERKTVHDKAAAVLGDEHKTDSPYCSYCSRDSAFYDSKDYDSTDGNDPDPKPLAVPLNKDLNKGADPDMEQKDFDEFKTQTEKSIGELTTLVKSLAPAAPAKTAEQIALEKAAAEAGPITAASLAAALGPILKSNNEELVKTLTATPGSRTNGAVPAGAGAMHKSQEDIIAEALKNAQENKTASTEALTKKKDRLTGLEAQRNVIIEKRKAGAKFSLDDEAAAAILEKQFSALRSEIHYEESTGQTV